MLQTCRDCSAASAVGLERCPECGSSNFASASARLPMIQVACRTDGCRAEGNVQAVRLPPAGLNLVQFPALVCTLCGLYVETVTPWPGTTGEEGDTDDMAKISAHGGPTNDNPPDDGVHMEAGTGEPAAAEVDSEGGEQSSPGSSSETSSAKDETSPKKSAAGSPKRARTTASRSRKARTGSSSAPGTDGDQTEATSETESDSDDT